MAFFWIAAALTAGAVGASLALGSVYFTQCTTIGTHWYARFFGGTAQFYFFPARILLIYADGPACVANVGNLAPIVANGCLYFLVAAAIVYGGSKSRFALFGTILFVIILEAGMAWTYWCPCH